MSGLGWLEYGAVDDSILLQHPLTSNPLTYFSSICAAATAPGSGHIFDSNGFSPNNAGYFLLTGLVGFEKLDNCGQISFEVSRDWFCANNSSVFSSGYVPSTSETLMSTSPVTGSVAAICVKSSDGTLYSNGPLFSGLYSSFNSSGKKDTVTVNLGWSGGRVGGVGLMAVDGHIVGRVERNSATLVSNFNRLWIGCDRVIAGTFLRAPYFIKNLQISTKPPMFSIVPLLRNVQILSDSLWNTSLSSGTYKDVSTGESMKRELAAHGLECGTVTASVNGGYRIDNSVPSTYLKDMLPALLNTNPTMVVIRAGTNDVQANRPSQAGWQQSVTNYITDCMAVSSVKIVMFLGIPSAVGSTTQNTAAVKEERMLGDTKIKASCDAWRAANPTDPRKVIFVDNIYEALGGENPPPGTYIGQTNGLYNDIHLSGYGHYLHGKAIAKSIIDSLG